MSYPVYLIESTEDVLAMQVQLEGWIDEELTIAVDTETGGIHNLWAPPGRGFCRLFQVGTTKGSFVIPAQDYHAAVGEVLEMLKSYPVVFANWQYDMHVIEREGWPVLTKVNDAILLHRVTRPWRNRHALKEIAASELGEWAKEGQSELKRLMSDNKWGWDDIPVTHPTYVTYAGFDTSLTAEVWDKMTADCPVPRSYLEELSYTKATYAMEKKGMAVSTDHLRMLKRKWTDECEVLLDKLQIAGIDKPLSVKQVDSALREHGFTPQEFSESGNPVLDKVVLKRLKAEGGVLGEMATDLMDYRRKSKWLSVYVDKMLTSTHEGRVHCTIKTLQAKTGRSSVTDPPLQTIPKDASTRGVFVADPGYELWAADYTSQEARILADVSGEPSLIKLFTEGDGDIHNLIAQRLDILRDTAKTVVYAKLFGAGDATLGAAIGGSKTDGERINKMMRSSFPQLEEWMSAVVATGEMQGFITLPNGMKRCAPKDEAYKYINYSIQGRGAIILKNAVVRLALSGYLDNLLMVVHDEVLFQFPEGEGEKHMTKITRIMQETLPSGIVLEVEASGPYTNWGEKYE